MFSRGGPCDRRGVFFMPIVFKFTSTIRRFWEILSRCNLLPSQARIIIDRYTSELNSLHKVRSRFLKLKLKKNAFRFFIASDVRQRVLVIYYRNVGNSIPANAVQHPRRTEISFSRGGSFKSSKMRLAVSQMKYSERGTDRQTIYVIYALDLCIFLFKKR